MIGATTNGLPKLVVVGGEVVTRAGHHFNELLGYREASAALDLTCEIFATRNSSVELMEALSAHAALDPPPSFRGTNTMLVDRLVDYFDRPDCPTYEQVWNHSGLTDKDYILFTAPHPWLIRGVARWLADRDAKIRPTVFFRFIGHEMFDLKKQRYRADTALFRLAARELQRSEGQSRVHFFANSQAVARLVSRGCNRHTHVMPLPKYFPKVALNHTSDGRTVIVFLNVNSGAIVEQIPKVVSQLSRGFRPFKVIIKADDRVLPKLPEGRLRRLGAELLPLDLSTEAYFDSLARSSVVVLAYDPDAYKTLSSGVFAEAVGMGKIVVVPSQTWMSEQITKGLGAGLTFSSSAPDDIVAAVKTAAKSVELQNKAHGLAPAARAQHSSSRALELLMALEPQGADARASYALGDEIDFSSGVDSRLFMRDGWGNTEEWGTSTAKPAATLVLPLRGALYEGHLRLRALVRPILARESASLHVTVRANGTVVASWILDPSAHRSGQWHEAVLPGAVLATSAGGALDLTFEVRDSSPLRPSSSPAKAGDSGLGLTTLLVDRVEPCIVSDPSSLRPRTSSPRPFRLGSWLGGRTKRLSVDQVDIVGIVRFSVVTTTANWFLDWRQTKPSFESWCETIFDEDRIRRRMDLFENITMPSLMSQGADGFRVHVLASTLLPRHWADRLSEIINPHRDRFRLHYLKPDNLEVSDYGKSVIADLDTTRPFASFRLDDDDALATSYVGRLRRHLHTTKVGHAVSLCRGYNVYVSPGADRFGLHRGRWSNHSAGLAFVSGPKQPRTIFDLGFGHENLHHTVPVITDGRRVAFAYFLHGGNSVGDQTIGKELRLGAQDAEQVLRNAGVVTDLSSLAKLWSPA